MRFNPREYQRNNHRSQKIGQQCIRGKTRRTSAQLTGNDRSSSSRRTNKTYHSPFKNFPIHLLHRTAHQQSRHNQTRHRLKQQQPAMPSFGFKSRASTLQKVSSNCAKIKAGVRRATNPFKQGFTGANQGIFAKKKYPAVPASIAKGNVQFFIRRRSIPVSTN